MRGFQSALETEREQVVDRNLRSNLGGLSALCVDDEGVLVYAADCGGVIIDCYVC